MQIVIDLDQECYDKLTTLNYPTVWEKAIINGTPLPEGHGDLKDADALTDYFWDNRSKLFDSKECRIAIDKAPTIIEADK